MSSVKFLKKHTYFLLFVLENFAYINLAIANDIIDCIILWISEVSIKNSCQIKRLIWCVIYWFFVSWRLCVFIDYWLNYRYNWYGRSHFPVPIPFFLLPTYIYFCYVQFKLESNQSIIIGMPCVPNMDMMVGMNNGMMMGPPGSGPPPPPHHHHHMMMVGPPQNGPMVPPPMDHMHPHHHHHQMMAGPPAPQLPPEKPAKGSGGGRSSAPRSATPKNKNAQRNNNAAANNAAPPATMMVQGKPAVMVPPNMNASATIISLDFWSISIFVFNSKNRIFPEQRSIGSQQQQ